MLCLDDFKKPDFFSIAMEEKDSWINKNFPKIPFFNIPYSAIMLMKNADNVTLNAFELIITKDGTTNIYYINDLRQNDKDLKERMKILEQEWEKRMLGKLEAYQRSQELSKLQDRLNCSY